MNILKYQLVFAQKLQASVRKLKEKRNNILQHDNDPKQRSKSTKEWPHQKKLQILKWPSQNPVLN